MSGFILDVHVSPANLQQFLVDMKIVQGKWYLSLNFIKNSIQTRNTINSLGHFFLSIVKSITKQDPDVVARSKSSENILYLITADELRNYELCFLAQSTCADIWSFLRMLVDITQ